MRNSASVEAPGSTIERIQGAIVRHIGRARRALSEPGFDDQAVHDARKDLKRARSGLRLLRPLDEATYRRENMRLRDTARRLSPLRDHKVLLARITRLLASEAKPERRRLLLRMRKDLYNARRRDWRALRSPDELARLGERLADSAKRVRKWQAPAQADVHAAPDVALKKLYRKGRKALARAQKDPTDERLHEARKQAKHLGQALEMLAGKSPPKKAGKLVSRAEDVGDHLGDDHDLAVVEARFLALPGDQAKPKKKLRARIEARRTRLQKKALKAGDKLFRKKTRRALARAAERALNPP